MTVRVNHDVIVAIDRARCPQCGDMVFVPSVRLPPDDLTDPVVWCRDMGHWQGRLSECDNAEAHGRAVASTVQPLVGHNQSGAK